MAWHGIQIRSSVAVLTLATVIILSADFLPFGMTVFITLRAALHLISEEKR